MSLSSIATDGYLQGGLVTCVATEGFLCVGIPAEETIIEEGGGDSSGWKRYPHVITAELYLRALEAKEIRETSAELPKPERIEVEVDYEQLTREVVRRLSKISEARYQKAVTTRTRKMAEKMMAERKAEAMEELAPILMILLAEDL